MTVDLSKLAFSSDYRYERVVARSSVPFTVAGGGFANTTVTIAHNLGYVPYIKARYSFGNGKYYPLFAGTDSYNIDGNGVQISNVNATTTNYVVLIENFGVSAVSGTIYYRVYAEPQI